ncbi:hypothetical protein ISE67_08730 [Pseudomonas aeruginosa]|nr:hypothetical protein [Pseudomonas aeruginosa]
MQIGHQGLTDIDSLALAVRDPESKRLIHEAISAYRGGALRSAIVATWIAVSYDIIVKAKELASHGDSAAARFVQEIDQAVQDQDVRKMQTVESNLMTTAKSTLQLFATHESEDLERLQRDRNLCAHPAFSTDDVLFQPTPELVRTHITHALKHLLINAPLQGKSAIERFHADLLSPSFPVDENGIATFIRAKYLDRAKDVMVANLIKSLLAAPFGGESNQYIGRRHQLARILREIAKAKAAIYDTTARDHVARKFEAIPDELVLSISAFVEGDTRVWEWMSEPARIRYRQLLQTADADTLKQHSAFDAFAIPELAEILLSRFDDFNQRTQISIISEHPRQEFVAKALEIYGTARSFRAAEELGRGLIVRLAAHFKAEDIRELLAAVMANDQVSNAGGTPDILVAVFDEACALLPVTYDLWQNFIDEMTERAGHEEAYYAYPALRAKINAATGNNGGGQKE